MVAFEGERVLVIGDKDDLSRSGGDAERRGREGAEHVDDHGKARRLPRTVDEARDADIHVRRGQSTVAVNGRRPLAKRSSERSPMSSVCARPSSISSTTSCPVAGACMYPWPEKPAAT